MDRCEIIKQLIESICKEIDCWIWLDRLTIAEWHCVIKKTSYSKSSISIYSNNSQIELGCCGAKFTLNIADPEFDSKCKSWINNQFIKCELTNLITSI